MAIVDSTNKAFIPRKMKILLVPLALLLAMVVLALIVFKTGIARISNQRVDLQKATKNETILAQKQQVLQTLESDILSYADSAIIAMPDKNPSLIALSQLKILAENNEVSLNEIKVSGELKDKSGTSKTTISFEAEGALTQVLNYLILVKNFAPLSTMNRADLTYAGGAMRANIDLAVYWAPLPTKLPAISEPVLELTAGEASLIAELSNLEQPIFTEVLPAAPSARIDPFAY